MTHGSRSFSFARLFAITRKEIIQIRRDKRSLALAFLLPLILLVLFGYAINTDVDHIQTAVIDRDRTPESRALVEAFSRSGYFTISRSPATDREAEALIDRGDVRVALVIPERFAVDLVGGRGAPVELILDGSDAKTATVARGYADAIARSYSTKVLVQHRRPSMPVSAEARVWYNQALDSRSVVVPALIAIIMSIIAAMLTSLTVAREWERGTMEQLAATPVSRAEVIFGKLVPYLVIGIIDVIVAVTIGVVVFDVPFRGSVLLFSAATLIFLSGVLGFGIMLSSAVKSQLLATQAAILATYMPALIFSGFMFPIDSMPRFLQGVSQIVPARYFVSITRGVFLKGIGLEVLWPSIVGLALYATFVLALSVRKFKKEIA